MFNINDLLTLDCMKDAKVVAGAEGTSHPIKWCHIVEFIEIEDWVGPDILIMMTGCALHDVDQELEKVLRAAIRKRVAGMIINIDDSYISKVPQSIIDIANAHMFTIITVPNTTSLMDISYQIGLHVFENRNNAINSLYSDAEYQEYKDKVMSSGILINEELLNTLQMYIDLGGNATLAAKNLFIHRNTMKYRIAKIDEMLQINIHTEKSRVLLNIILKDCQKNDSVSE